MSSRGKNHTRGTMQAWRGMAAEGYPGSRNGNRATPRYPSVLGRNSRWRSIARLAAKQAGWTFTDGFLWTAYGPYTLELFGSLWR